MINRQAHRSKIKEWSQMDFNTQIKKMLDDAMSLLMNHDQHRDQEWIEDYEELIREYESII